MGFGPFEVFMFLLRIVEVLAIVATAIGVHKIADEIRRKK